VADVSNRAIVTRAHAPRQVGGFERRPVPTPRVELDRVLRRGTAGPAASPRWEEGSVVLSFQI
jgi:hypothetical protein